MSTVKNLTKYFHSDTEHGWLAVKRKEIETLGLTDQISIFSYAKGSTVYLEEDVDLGLYKAAVEASGVALQIKEAKPVKRSNIRGFKSFGQIA